MNTAQIEEDVDQDGIILCEQDFEEALENIFDLLGQEIEPDGEVDASEFLSIAEPFQGCTVRSFQRAGVMTMNRGVEVTTSSGMTFQITIVQK